MNITKIKQASIRNFFIKNSKEMKEISLIKSRVCDRIYNILLNSLNDSERYLMNTDIANYYNKISGICIDSTGNYSELFGFDFPTRRIKSFYWENENHHYDEIYGIFSIFNFGEGRQLPEIIRTDFIGWKQLSSLNPGEFDLIKSDLKKAIDLMNTLYYKISELSNLLNSSEIGLVDIKKYFPELYKVIKS